MELHLLVPEKSLISARAQRHPHNRGEAHGADRAATIPRDKASPEGGACDPEVATERGGAAPRESLVESATSEPRLESLSETPQEESFSEQSGDEPTANVPRDESMSDEARDESMSDEARDESVQGTSREESLLGENPVKQSTEGSRDSRQAELRKMKINELRQLCRANGLTATGTKKVIMNRIMIFETASQ